MERISSSVGGSRSYRGDTNAIAEENFQYGFEVQRLLTTENLLHEAPSSESGNSFTALLGLPANQAMELVLHELEPNESPANGVNEIWRDQRRCERNLSDVFNYTPTFPSNKGLVERAARYSIFAAAEDSPDTSYVPSNSSENLPKLKSEPADSESSPSSPNLVVSNVKQKSTKRKEREKKVKISAKTTKDVGKTTDQNKDGEKLPYVHVRARRGQATDSHSLAERARRKKINARMKLLQELVPGCSKISGTAMVLDEIINHVQSLQRQVELLSMRLAAVNPRNDFSFDGLLPSEGGCLTFGVGTSFPSVIESSIWPEIQVINTAGGHQYPNQNQQQLSHLDVLRPPMRERDESNNFTTSPDDSVFSYNSSTNSANLQANQLKMEI